MENLTVNLKPIGFRSTFQYIGKVYNADGEFRANSEKKLTGINGTIKVGDSFKATFSGESMPDSGLRYSLSSIGDLNEAGAIADFLSSVVESVNTRLSQE